MSGLHNRESYSYSIGVVLSRSDTTGIIFDIQRFSVHDGPGIRTTVFLKGCPLRCSWCHNPESQNIEPELFFEESLCVLCGACIEVCPEDVHTIKDGIRDIEWSLCKRCGKCVDICYAGALLIKGRTVTVDEVIRDVLRDREYYGKSGGGITLSGGEPLMQPVYSKALLETAKECGIHTAIETSGCAKWELFETLLPSVDFVMYDVKIFDSGLHKKLCGMGNELILENLNRLVDTEKQILVRIPLIPQITDTEKNLDQIGEYLRQIGAINVELIPYHAFAEIKCRAFGREYRLDGLAPQKDRELQKMRRLISGYGLETKIGI
jgi:pyruvate formate lyase activating enzyme